MAQTTGIRSIAGFALFALQFVSGYARRLECKATVDHLCDAIRPMPAAAFDLEPIVDRLQELAAGLAAEIVSAPIVDVFVPFRPAMPDLAVMSIRD